MSADKDPLTDEELAVVEKLAPVTSDEVIMARMAAEIRAHRRTLVRADDLIIAARALSDADLGRLRRSINSLVHEGTVDELTTMAVALPDIQLGLLRRFVNGEFENRIRFTKGLTEDEQKLLAKSKIDCVRAVRERTGLGLADSKELVDRWECGERS